VVSGETALFGSWRLGSSYGLFASRGTRRSTMMISHTADPAALGSASGLAFVADIYRRLWVSDGQRVQHVATARLLDVPTLTEARGSVFYWADDGVHGYELWKSVPG
jgi:hypothetical protein